MSLPDATSYDTVDRISTLIKKYPVNTIKPSLILPRKYPDQPGHQLSDQSFYSGINIVNKRLVISLWAQLTLIRKD